MFNNNNKREKITNIVSSIKTEIKQKYPNFRYIIKYKIIEDDINIIVQWVDGISKFSIENLLSKYAISYFDKDNNIIFLPKNNKIEQANCIVFNRRISQDIFGKCFENIKMTNNNLSFDELYKLTNNYCYNNDFICNVEIKEEKTKTKKSKTNKKTKVWDFDEFFDYLINKKKRKWEK